MTEKPKETPKEELECPKKYVYDTGIIFECKDNIRVEIIGEDVVNLLNELNDENIELHIQNDFLKCENRHMRDLIIENKQLKQQIKDLRLSVFDSIREADEIKCSCNPCVVEECVKRVIE